MMRWRGIGWGIVVLMAGAAGANADAIRFDLLPPEKRLTLKPKVLPGRALAAALSAEPPEGAQKIAADFANPMFATLTLGSRDAQRTFILAAEYADGKKPRFLADANRNGDLTDDAAVTVQTKEFFDADKRKWTQYSAQALLPLAYGAEERTVPVAFQWYDQESAKRIGGTPRLNYALPPAMGGELTLGGKTYRAELCDALGRGDYRGVPGAVAGVLLLIDVNGNGAYDARGEAFDIGQPFTIQKTTYEVQEMAASGATFTLTKSAKPVPEIPPPPDLRPGQPVVPFTVKTMDGKTARFPQDYKGKLVLLYFWASWCGDCQAEVPFVSAAYAKYQGKGLEILGVSLDQPNQGANLTAYLKANKMPWAQVYDGKFWDATIAKLYGITWIPTAYLVDGDTGKVLAEGDCVLGKTLDHTLKAALDKKFPPL